MKFKNKIKKLLKNNSLKTKLLCALILFAVAILVFLWIFQVSFLKSYYESSVKNDLKNVVKNIEKNYEQTENYREVLNKISYQENLCIEIYDYRIRSFASIQCNNMEDRNLSRYKNLFMNGDIESNGFEFTNEKFQNKILMYGLKLDEEQFVFVRVNLEPVEATISILRRQLIYVTILLLALSILVAYYISRMLSKPIEQINNSAKRIAKGDYTNLITTEAHIKELDELSETLNHATKELAKTEELRRELMANVSHDLKTPLTMIKAYAELVRDINYNKKVKREDNLNVIISEADRLNLLVNDILELSKIQSDTYVLQKEEFNLSQVMQEIIARYHIYELKGYQIEYIELYPELVVNADKKRIEQVIYNLINNALNYTGEDKKVIINVIPTERFIRVEIKDTGKGIKKDELDLIWDKYYKADKTHSRLTIGTGIGLSIVKSILVAHQFKYGIETEENKGSTFYFEMPIEK